MTFQPRSSSFLAVAVAFAGLEAAEQFGSVTATYPPEGLIYQLQLDLKAIEIPRTVIPLPNANIARSVGNS